MRYAAALLALHIVVGLLVHDAAATAPDRAAFDAIDHLRSRAGVDVIKVLTDIGSFPIVAAVVLAAACFAHRRGQSRLALTLIAAFLATVVLYDLAKAIWDRPRPADRLASESSTSYPSGHSAQAVAWLAAAWITANRALIAAAAVLMIAIGLSRLYLQVHYLTDVVGGFALAGAVYVAVLRRA